MDFNADTFDYEAEYEKIKKSVKKPNILILGATGVGKSSVVNRLFGRRVARVGAGVPVTRGIDRYESGELDVVLYDSEGYEIGGEANTSFREVVLGFIDRSAGSGLPAEQVHEAWYCVSAANKRITDMDVSVVREIAVRRVPVAIIVTQIDGVDEDELASLLAAIESSCPGVAHFNTSSIEDDEVQEALQPYLQWEGLMDWALENLDASLREGFVSSLAGALRQKRTVALKRVIPIYTALAAATGAAPIPFADAAVLIPIQVKMSMHIMNTFGMDSDVTSIAQQLVGSEAISQLGKILARTLSANLAKMLPFVGSIAGGLVNATVAASFTGAMGGAVCELCYRYAYAAVVEGRSVEVGDFFSPELIGELLKKIGGGEKR